MQTLITEKKPLGWAKLGILGAVLIICFGAITVLALEVNRKIDEQAAANSDNIQWVLSQLEVEYLGLLSAIDNHDDTGDVSNIRLRFDVLYSRLATFKTGKAYDNLRNDIDFAARLGGISSTLDNLIPVIDSSDDNLAQSLPALRDELETLATPIRQMALIGIDFFANVSDSSRHIVWLTLMRVAALTMALVLALAILSVVLFQLYRVAQRNADEISATSARLEAMVSSTLDAVIVINEAGRIVEFNGSAESIFGYSRAEAIGAPLVDMIIPLKHRKAHLEGMKRHLRDGTYHVVGRGRVQMDALRKNGEMFPCEFSIARANTKTGVLFVAFLRDNSAQVAAERELLAARDEALAGEKAKADFMAVMSHEMRTPLNGMLGTIELLNDTELTEKQQNFLKIMETSGRLLLHHVNDVLDIARLDSNKVIAERNPFDLSQLVAEIIDSQHGISATNRTEVLCNLTDLGSPTVLGDEKRLRQVIMNLLSNAIKFTRDGTVSIEAEQIGDSDTVEFRISDTGIGIHDDDLNRIFDDFVTLDSSYAREFGGTGLGLGIAKRLVESMDGTIGAESEPGDGSLFWFRIPLPILSKSKSTALKSADAGKELKISNSMDILVVEDNQINQLVVEEMLTKDGHRVTLANDGREGVDKAAEQYFDLILMDISMPRMDGIAACVAIRNGDGPNRNSRIIALTANALPEDIERFKEAGMNDVLIKPISRSKLARTVSVTPIEHNTPVAIPTPQPDKDVPVETVDSEMLANLIEDLGPQMASNLISTFVAETDTMVEHLVETPPEDDVQMIAEIHKLAGSSSMFGTVGFSSLLRSLETIGKTQSAEKMRDKAPEMRELWDATRAELTELVDDMMADE